MWIAFKTRLDSSRSIVFMCQVVETISTVAVVTEFSTSKTFTVAEPSSKQIVQLQLLQNLPPANIQIIIV